MFLAQSRSLTNVHYLGERVWTLGTLARCVILDKFLKLSERSQDFLLDQ